MAQMGSSSNQLVRTKLIGLISECHCEFIVSDQINRTRSRNWRERLRSITYLPYIAPPELITKALQERLKDEYLDVRLAAALALSTLRDPSVIRPILDNLAVIGSWPINRLIEIVQGFDQLSIPVLEEYLRDPHASNAGMQVAVAVLGLQKMQSSVPVLIECTSSNSFEIRIEAYRALGSIGSEKCLPMLLGGIQDKSWEVRAVCAKGLRSYRESAVISALKNGLSDLVWWVRFNCASSLDVLGEEGRSALQETLKSSDRFSAEMAQMILERNPIKVEI